MKQISQVIVEGPWLHCQKCDHYWQQRGETKPRRCNNQGQVVGKKSCRSMRWDADKYPGAGPFPPRPGGGSGEGTTLPIIGPFESEPLRKPVVPVYADTRSPHDAVAA